tara:strand:+ start:496 stop:897 length:402 start_codon:yes stop_codon:yes gene_type:complete
MPYIGRPQATGPYIKLDDISDQFDGNRVSFYISVGGSPFFSQNPYSMLVSLDGVIQEPIKSFVINENQITFASAPSSNSSFYCIVLGTTLNTASLTSLTIGTRTSAATIALNGDHLGVKLRDGTKGFIAFNKA